MMLWCLIINYNMQILTLQSTAEYNSIHVFIKVLQCTFVVFFLYWAEIIQNHCWVWYSVKLIRRQRITGNFFVNVWVTSHKTVLTQTASSGALNRVNLFPLKTLLFYMNFCSAVLSPFPPMSSQGWMCSPWIPSLALLQQAVGTDSCGAFFKLSFWTTCLLCWASLKSALGFYMSLCWQISSLAWDWFGGLTGLKKCCQTPGK